MATSTRNVLLLCSVSILSGGLIAACGQSDLVVGASEPGGGGSDGGSENDGAISPTFDAPSFGDTTSPASGGNCSSDLQNIVDENGVVIQACPPEQGCANGVCIPACQAAANNKGTIGCDFVVATPSFFAVEPSPCFAVFVTNNWGKPATITVTRDGTSYPVGSFGRIAVPGQPETAWPPVPASGVPVGQVAVLFMSSDPTSEHHCPLPPAINAGTAVPAADPLTSNEATGVGKAWHIVTDVPSTLYDVLPYGGAPSFLPSAELLLPTTAWGTNYYGVVPVRGQDPFHGPQWGQVVASQDGTEVKVVPNVDLPGGNGVSPAPKNQVATYRLNAGEFLQWQDTQDMSGTIFSSDKPMLFNGGSAYLCLQGGCDSAHQAIPPISAMGFDYVAPPYTTRRADLQPESIPYRVVGVVANTTLTYDPPVPAGPASLAAGQVFDFTTTGAFRVTSQDAGHPFYVGQVMLGCNTLPVATRTGGDPALDLQYGPCLGDEEFVNILPPAQFLHKYVFFADPSYSTTNLVFVREKTGGAFKDVTLDCAGKLVGWRPIDAKGDFEITDIDLVRAKVQNGKCNNGPNVARSDGPFGLMVWGLDRCASYAYPAGGNVVPINHVVVPPVPR